MNLLRIVILLITGLLILVCPAGAALVEMSAWGLIDRVSSYGAGPTPELQAVFPPDTIGQTWQWTIIYDTSTAETPRLLPTNSRLFAEAIVSAELTLAGSDALALLDPGAINNISLISSAGDGVLSEIEGTALAGAYDVSAQCDFFFISDMFAGDNNKSTIPTTLPVYQTSDFTSAYFHIEAGDDTGGVFLSGSATEFYVQAVPEPATMSLLAIGGVGLLLKRRRRRA